MKENTNNELEHLTGDLFYNNNRGGKHTKSRVIRIRKCNLQGMKTLNSSTLQTGPTDTHTHPKRNWTPWVYFGPQPCQGTCPASCGHTDSKPPRWDSNPRPEVHGPRTRPSHHDRRRSQSPPRLHTLSNRHQDCTCSAIATKTAHAQQSP